MSRTTTLISLLLHVLLIIPASAQHFAWATALGNNEYDGEASITVDEQSNLFVGGNFKGVVDFDHGPGVVELTSGAGGFVTDSYIARYDSTGALIWVKQVSGTVQQFVRDIEYDSAGYIYVLGYFIGETDFDPGPNSFVLTTPNFTYDTYLLKLDLDGNFIWVRAVGGNGNEYAEQLTIDNHGHLILTGIFSGTSDFDPGPNEQVYTVSGLSDMFISKYTPDGDFQWASISQGTFNSTTGGVETDDAGNIYVCGAFDDIREFMSGPDSLLLTARGLWDGFVLKLDANGNLNWVRQLGTMNGDNWAWDLELDGTGHVYVTGHYSNGLDFNPDPVEADIHAAINTDVYVWKINLDGDHVWVRPFGGISLEQGRDIEIDRNGSLYVTGHYAETVDFNPGPGVYELTSTGHNDENDAFVMKLNREGEFEWAHTLGGLETDYGYGVQLNATGDIFLTGAFFAAAGFNPAFGTGDSLVSAGLADTYLVRWRQCLTSYDTLGVFTCGEPYVSPSGLYTWNESGTYQDTLSNKAGCDSVITINLSISSLNLTVTQQGNTLIGLGDAGNLYWVDCDNNFAIVGQGNEFTPSADGHYAVVGSGIICTDTSDCFAFVMTGMDETWTFPAFVLSPNPSADHVRIDLHATFQHVRTTVYNAVGDLVRSQDNLDVNEVRWSCDYPAGMYFIYIEADNRHGWLIHARQ